MIEPKEEGKNLLIYAAIYPTLHDDLERIKRILEDNVKGGGSKTARVRLALFVASRMSTEDLLKSMLDLNERDLIGDQG